MKKSSAAIILAYLVALSSLPAASGANNNNEREASPTTITYDAAMIDLSKVTAIRSDGSSDADQPAYLCGYDLAREHRGDCGNAYNVDIAPGERWYKFTTTDFDMGNMYVFAIENHGDPHLVDVTVEVCFSDTFETGTLHCYDWNEMYGDQTLRYTFTRLSSKKFGFIW